MKPCEKIDLHDALLGTGRILANIVHWFEQILEGVSDSEGNKIKFLRLGDYSTASTAGALSWQTEDLISGSCGWFRLRSDVVLHPNAAANFEEPFIVWQIFASSAKVAKNLELVPFDDYPHTLWEQDGFIDPILEYRDESGGRETFYRRSFIYHDPSLLVEKRDSFVDLLSGIVDAMQASRFRYSNYQSKLSQI